MGNPLYDRHGGNNIPNQPQNMMQAFNQFRSTFQGNPQQIVQNLLNSGRMSQGQFNRLQQMASQYARFFKF